MEASTGTRVHLPAPGWEEWLDNSSPKPTIVYRGGMLEWLIINGQPGENFGPLWTLTGSHDSLATFHLSLVYTNRP